MHPRTRRALEALPSEERAAAEAAITRSTAHRATLAGRAEEEEVIRKVREEFPPPGDRPGAGQGPLRAASGTRATGLEPVRCLGADRHRPGDALEARDGQGDESHGRYTPGPGPRPQQAALVVAGR
jgi:hypothetical protein